ncbi:hypothetical protein PV721_01235 [Streptomyces sp. MB09-01]|uniref:hypothetical protein n=1 Tax=Streptomyces sp. MB09-01 TaxID=3028666 RepID=UPI0029A5897D|nr:hypothetical protein [Streptomyces sp. MB09-01]MDX3533016.1 hypothetical protein [Streptomyces sp. MB09-01]
MPGTGIGVAEEVAYGPASAAWAPAVGGARCAEENERTTAVTVRPEPGGTLKGLHRPARTV